MTHASAWLRRVEITLWILGVSLLGAALGQTLARWQYQAEQERALVQRGPAVFARAEKRGVAVAVAPEQRLPQPEIASRVERVAASTPRVEKKQRATDLDPAALGRIEIPRLGVAAIVKEGDDEWTLARAVGLVPGSARPGELGNIVLAGHRDTFFRSLSRIKLNDRIRMVVPPNIYEYRVQSLRVVSPNETSVLASNGVEELTLVTCYPFRFIGPAPERFIVSAARTN